MTSIPRILRNFITPGVKKIYRPFFSSSDLSVGEAIPATTTADSQAIVPEPKQKLTRTKVVQENLDVKALSAELKTHLAEVLKSTPTPKRLLRVQSIPPVSLYLIDNKVATLITEKMSEENLDSSGTIIEINPGHGILTTQLISKLGIKKVHCFEEEEEFSKLLATKFKSRINLIPMNYMSIPKQYHHDQLDGGSRLGDTLKSLSNTKSNKLYIIGASMVNSAVNFALMSFITQRFIFDEDYNWDVTYYLALGSQPAAVLTATPESGFTEYRQSSVSFQLFFNHKLLGKVPRQAYLPWQNVKPSWRTEDSRAKIKHDTDNLQLLKFKPNKELVARIGVDRLVPLWYFIRHHLQVRKSAVIPELEHWIPGCGPRLIRQGYSIYTQFGSLTPDKILELFLEFTSWPEFESCSFLAAVDKYMSKIHTSDDEV